jgi:hypothetical protein
LFKVDNYDAILSLKSEATIVLVMQTGKQADIERVTLFVGLAGMCWNVSESSSGIEVGR